MSTERLRILLKFPTRGRPERAAATLTEYSKRASGKHEVAACVVVDQDDGISEVLAEACAAAENENFFVSIGVTPSRGKIAACNAHTPDPAGGDEWQVLVMGSDDLLPCDGWDDIIASRMVEHWPQFDGCLHFPDGNRVDLCTYPVMGWRWYQMVGHVYHPDYKSVYADNEAHLIAVKRGKMQFCNFSVLLHEHPAFVASVPVDDTYRRNEDSAMYTRDMVTYESRREREYGMPPVVLSVLVCGLAGRENTRNLLLESLHAQRDADRDVALRTEVVVQVDHGEARGGMTVGAKRNLLLRRSVGEYVAFVDDDDAVAADYLKRILHAIDAYDGGIDKPDCIGMNLRRLAITAEGRRWDDAPYAHRLGNNSVGFSRPINHINPVRRDIAMKAGFPEQSWSEDSEHAKRLAPLLNTTEVIYGPTMYFYIDDEANSATRPHSTP
jgi:hypothetical protein